jgi:hypothetical protein
MANTKAQVTGHMTISGSNKLPMEVKAKILEAEEGHVRKFRKVLIDPETKQEVVVQGTARIGGLDKKTGQPINGRKQSLTCYVAFKVQNVESFLAPLEKETETSDQEDLDAMAASLGLEA